MADLQIIGEAEGYRLLRDGRGCCAVVEARSGRVYSVDCEDRAEAPDTAAGMAAVVDHQGWQTEDAARRRFAELTRRERHYSETLW